MRDVLLLQFGATRRPKDAPRSGSFFTPEGAHTTTAKPLLLSEEKERCVTRVTPGPKTARDLLKQR